MKKAVSGIDGWSRRERVTVESKLKKMESYKNR